MAPHDSVNRWVESTRSAAGSGPGEDEPVERIPSPDLSEDDDDEVRPKDLPVNAEYLKLLENAKMFESHDGPAPEHSFLYESFKREVLLDALPEDEALEKALIELRTLIIVRIDESWVKRSLWAGLYTIIRDFLNPDYPKDRLYVVQGDVWDRVPKHLRGMVDLSRPQPDTVISIYPRNPKALRLHEAQKPPTDDKAGSAVEDVEEPCHPLSNVAMYRILADPATKDRAPVKSTSVHPNFVMAHDLMVLEVEIGSTPWPADDEDRSPEVQMQDARARACNAMYFQLGAIAQLRMDVPLPADKDKEGRLDRFILAMTVCGDIWTVEYAYRARVEDPTTTYCTITSGNYATSPKLFLSAIKRVIHINMMNTFPEKAARIQVLLDQAKPLPRNTKIDVHDHDYRYRPFIWIRGYAYKLGAERRAKREDRVARRARWEREKEAANGKFDKHALPSVMSREEAREYEKYLEELGSDYTGYDSNDRAGLYLEERLTPGHRMYVGKR
ncbi:hypothetical protein FFLO_06422 [Filobasidium floriforme]|uniref:Uncharacterized protein n=1 Tax=Filobasidium floriforme TaxID=5210 RepID=A0A8K0NN12_9TREE|nr:hypothetical protein FFLO_06422 [Filobasidium floriforme]